MLETARPWSASVSLTAASCSASRSRMLTFQALRTSAYVRPRPEATLHCSSKSGAISSMNPDRVHMTTSSRGSRVLVAVQPVDAVDQAQRPDPLAGVDPERLRPADGAVEVGDEEVVRRPPVGLAEWRLDRPLVDGLGAA